MLRPFLLSGSIALVATAFAQPYQYGCHYFRNQQHPVTSMTAADRALIDDIIARSDTFDILHYDIAIDVTNVTAQQIKAATTITYTPLMAGQTFIRFELWDLQVDSVTSPGGALAFSNDGQTLKVDFTTVPAVGSVDTLTVYYQGHPHRDPDWGGFYFESGYIYNLGIGLTTIPPNFGKVWYPCFDSFVERATYAYHVKSAGLYRAHCQGDFLGETQLGGDTVVRSFGMDRSMTTHLSAIAVADYRDSNFVHTGAYGDIPVRLTAKPTQLAAMASKFGDIGSAIDACEFWYGPYPWQRVGYVLTTDGALEIPTNIAYPDFMPSQSILQNRGLFTHELGHHWWGDIVAPYTQNDMWMKEGPAEYSSHLIEEWIGGPSALVKQENDNMLYVLRTAFIQDGGYLALSPMPDAEIYGLHTYYKGAAVIHNLRGYLGDSLFRQGMTQVQVVHANSALDAAGFRDALEDATGYDLHPFFDDQVFTPGFSVFVPNGFTAQQNGTQWAVDLSIKQKLRGTTVFHHDVPLDITLISATGQRQRFNQLVGDEFSSVQLQADFDPAMVVLNEDVRLNQARMAFEDTLIPGVSSSISQPWVDLQLFKDTIVDSTFLRIEHIWAGADQTPLGFGIDQVSDSHYWTVDGLWPEGTAMHAKVNYTGNLSTSLDNGLYGTTEEGAFLVYRSGPGLPWEVYPDQTVNAGILTNGLGSINIDVLRRGQYAFAKGSGFIGIPESTSVGGKLTLYPNPARDAVSVQLPNSTKGPVQCTILGNDGRMVMQASRSTDGQGRITLNVSELAAGQYILHVADVAGKRIGDSKFSITDH
ncbi:MAG: T9SS type A sorting domain-containing protein [Flavobacteriales bacterium]|nr:T9SS type A sorting domain-containing protein [Flavobacteriales bacterium]